MSDRQICGECNVGIRCYFGTGDSKIWFFREDLEKARFY